MKPKVNAFKRHINQALIAFCIFFLCSCSDYFKNDYVDNSPTSGKLKVYYDEGMELHIKNQVYTFQAIYPNAHVELIRSSESQAVQALYNDSCEAIIISRMLNEVEKKAFHSKGFVPRFSPVAESAVLLIVNKATPIAKLSYEDIEAVLKQGTSLKDSLGNELKMNILFDKNNSSVIHYMLDSVVRSNKLSSVCSILNSSIESINYIAGTPNAIAFIDFAWLSDVDDSLFKVNKDKIRFIAVSKKGSNSFEYPHQSSLKLGNYAFPRTVYVYRKTGDFTLAKGFESFVAGPKGQLTFLKQGLLPARQSERALDIKTEN